ncbi:MAG: MOSC domain-containing protein [Clostridiales bacterium]|nr:MOSC domain-containing protein [Clostridiales bacterium]
MGRVEAVCISPEKGTVKKDIGSCLLKEDHGLENDAHAGSARQVSLLSKESVDAFRERTEGRVDLPAGVFGENLLISGFDFRTNPVGTRFGIGNVVLEITSIGKKCHSGCEIMKKTGDCIMPREGVFARVVRGGTVTKGDEVILVSIPYSAAVLTASDRSYEGKREDLSGPAIREILVQRGYRITDTVLVSDDRDMIERELKRICDEGKTDVIFTTGGTGFSPRDNMPEATKAIADKDVPGISEAIRSMSMKITPNAMLSRAVSVIRGKTLIINLPGSPKAVKECLEFVLPPLSHGLGIMRGEQDG